MPGMPSEAPISSETSSGRGAVSSVLRRRLEFLEHPGKSFFLEEETGRAGYRPGMITIARGINHAERQWLREELGEK